MNTVMVAKYGAEALEHLRQAQLMLQAVSAIGQLEQLPWAVQAQEWYTSVASLVAIMEDTTLSDTGVPTQPRLKVTLKETLEQAMRERRGVFLRVERKDGRVEDVAFEPYSFRTSPRDGECLFAFNVEHNHLERIPLHAIRYIIGIGEVFAPRWDVEVDR